jgi:hypothetical protein
VVCIYASNPSNNHTVGDADQAMTDLANNRQFVLSMPEGPAGPNQLLTRQAARQAFVLIQYSLG